MVGATPEEDEQRQRQRQRQRELAMEQQQPTTLARDGDGAGVPVPVPVPAPAGGRVSTQLKAKLAHLLDWIETENETGTETVCVHSLALALEQLTPTQPCALLLPLYDHQAAQSDPRRALLVRAFLASRRFRCLVVDRGLGRRFAPDL